MLDRFGRWLGLGDSPAETDMDHNAPQDIRDRRYSSQQRPSHSYGTDRGPSSTDGFASQPARARSRSVHGRTGEAGQEHTPIGLQPVATPKPSTYAKTLRTPARRDDPNKVSEGRQAAESYVSSINVHKQVRSERSAASGKPPVADRDHREDYAKDSMDSALNPTKVAPMNPHSTKPVEPIEMVSSSVVTKDRFEPSPSHPTAFETTGAAPSAISREAILQQDIERLRQELDDAKGRARSDRHALDRCERERDELRQRHGTLGHQVTYLTQQLQMSQETAKHQSSELHSFRQHAHSQEGQIRALMVERDQAKANRLNMNDFDSSVDRTSEGDLVSKVQSINASLDELVLAIQEDLLPFLSNTPSDVVMADGPKTSPVICALAQTSPGDENWGLLTDVLLHDVILEWLHGEVFSSPVAAFKSQEANWVESLYDTVSSTESWRSSQRWRAITASAISDLPPVSARNGRVTKQSAIVLALLSRVTGASAFEAQAVKAKVEQGLGEIYENARQLSVIMKRDVVSIQASIILGSVAEDSHGSNETIWAEMGEMAGDLVVGDYGLGLVKTYEDGKTTVLLRAKVATEALIRHASKS